MSCRLFIDSLFKAAASHTHVGFACMMTTACNGRRAGLDRTRVECASEEARCLRLTSHCHAPASDRRGAQTAGGYSRWLFFSDFQRSLFMRRGQPSRDNTSASDHISHLFI